MTCQELIEFLMDYLEGELPAGQTRRFDHHLEGCRECANYLQSYRETVRLGQMVCREGEDALPAEVPEDLVQAILTARRAEVEGSS